MFRSITCAHCGTKQTTLFRIAPGKKVRCRACWMALPQAAMEDLLRMQGLMRMGDDEGGGGGGGGDWGGGGSSDDDSGAAEGEDEDEDDDGKGGKKKKKMGNSKSGGGFFASILRGVATRIITAVIGFGLLGTCCCCAVGYVMIFGAPAGFVGEWDAQYAKLAEKEKDKKLDKDKAIKEKADKDKDAKDKKDNLQELPDEPETVIVRLSIIGERKAKDGTGTYTNEDGKALSFKWKDLDDEKKTVVFEMTNKDDVFWKNIKSPATFSFALTNANNTLTFTSGGDSLTFDKVLQNQPPPVRNVGGGKKKKK